MPYTARKVGDQYCVFKKDGGKRVGCTDGNKEALRKYMAALHLNANESKIDTIKQIVREEIQRILYKKRKSN